MKPSQSHLPSLLGSLLFILGGALSLSLAAVLGAVTIGALLTGGNIDARQTILFAVLGFEGLILLSAAFVLIQKFMQKPGADAVATFSISAWQIAVLVIAAGTAVLAGHWIHANEAVNWLLLPVLTLPAVLLPIVILFGLGIRRIPLGPRWRTWSILGISMTLVPVVLFTLEVLAMVFILFLAVVFVMSQPELTSEIERLSTQIYVLGPEPEAMMRILAPWMLRPGVIALALSYIAVLVPLLEELFKPLGVWLFAGRIQAPAQGFALGALSGAAYALIETFGVSPQTTDWASLLLSRIGTGILHVTASALMGAAIVYAVHERRYARLLGMYLLSVSMHGLWNGLAILFTFATITEQFDQPGSLNGIATPVTMGMVLLGVIFLVLLVLSNRRIRQTIPQGAGEAPVI